MSFDPIVLPGIEPASDAGRAAVALAEPWMHLFAERSGAWDRAGQFPHDVVGELRGSGLLAVTVAAHLGGLGARGIVDHMAVASRLARGDASMAIALNMHFSSTSGLGRSGRADDVLREVVVGRAWLCAAVTEPGGNYHFPRTELRPDGAGWLLDGHKVLASGSPAATHIVASCVVRGGELDGLMASVVVPVSVDGVEVLDDWDGLGMRASGSGQVRFSGVELSGSTPVVPTGPFGEFTAATLTYRAMGNCINLAAMLGITEAAAAEAQAGVPDRATARTALAELMASLHAVAAVQRDLGRCMDDAAVAPPSTLEEAYVLMAEFQAAKILTHRASVNAVDLAMQVVGGRSYAGGHRLAQLYRDVRAGPFMEPYRPYEALGFVGSVAAGVEPDVRS